MRHPNLKKKKKKKTKKRRREATETTEPIGNPPTEEFIAVEEELSVRFNYIKDKDFRKRDIPKNYSKQRE